MSSYESQEKAMDSQALKEFVARNKGDFHCGNEQ